MTLGKSPDHSDTKILSGWEKVDIIAKALVPICIALAGWFINHNIIQGNRDAEIARSIQIDQQAQDASKRQSLLALPQFVDALFSDDQRRKAFAIKTIQILLPDDGTAILSSIAEDKTQPEIIRSQAGELATSGLKELINRLFDLSSPSIRKSAYYAITQSRIDASILIPELLSRAGNDLDNKNGTINTISLLGGLSSNDLKPFEGPIREYAVRAGANGPQTKDLVNKLLARF